MNLCVCIKMAPDPVEELLVADNGKGLEADGLRFKLSDADEHALEEALWLKDKHGGTVTVVALETPEVDEALHAALAKGADRVVKLGGDFSRIPAGSAARLLASVLAPEGRALPPETLVLVRTQAADDLEGEIGPHLAELLRVPYVAVVTGVAREGDGLVVTKEFAGGLRGEFALPLPCVLGIQSAEKPPRYVPIAKVRAAMKSGRIELPPVTPPEPEVRVRVEKMFKPQGTGRAQMLDGEPEQVAARIVDVMVQHGLV